MCKRYTVKTSIQIGENKHLWRTVGTGFPNEKTGGISVKLFAFPVSGELMLFPWTEEDEQRREERRNEPAQRGDGGDRKGSTRGRRS